jgi:hypothetical protein
MLNAVTPFITPDPPIFRWSSLQPTLIETFQALSRGQHGKIATEQPSTNQSRAPFAHSRAKLQLIEVPLS